MTSRRALFATHGRPIVLAPLRLWQQRLHKFHCSPANRSNRFLLKQEAEQNGVLRERYSQLSIPYDAASIEAMLRPPLLHLPGLLFVDCGHCFQSQPLCRCIQTG